MKIHWATLMIMWTILYGLDKMNLFMYIVLIFVAWANQIYWELKDDD